jgi:hypothetical protein
MSGRTPPRCSCAADNCDGGDGGGRMPSARAVSRGSSRGSTKLVNGADGRCPACSSPEAVPILYGFPSEDAARDAEAGKLVLGGCVVGDDDPQWQCRACGRRW